MKIYSRGRRERVCQDLCSPSCWLGPGLAPPHVLAGRKLPLIA